MTTHAGHWRQGRLDGERGSATGWAIGTTLVGLLLAALIVDGATAMATKAEAVHVAQQAARAGADQLDLAALRATGDIQLDPDAAHEAAAAWLGHPGLDGTVAATTEQVTVTATLTRRTVLLHAVGVDTFTLTAHAAAAPRPG